MKLISLLLITVITLIGCNDRDVIMKNNINSTETITSKKWDILAQKNIYFGHQSVGENIVEGILEVMKSNSDTKLNVKELKEGEIIDSPMFLHSSIGENGDPVGKIHDFQNKLTQGLGGQLDIAVAKLCFWDIRRNSDVNKIFNEYKSTINELKKEFPEIVFMHMTVPLMSHSESFIDNLKRLIKDDNDDLDNIKRNELNQLIISEFKGKEPLFDIAKYESTRQDGSRSYFVTDGNIYYYLPDEYTDDGGHLNEYSRKYIAQLLLDNLVNIATKSK